MPHTKTAKKRLRQNEKRRLRNRATKKAIKLQLRKVMQADKGAAAEQLQTEYLLAVRKLDKAAARRVIHPNTAARRKAQLARLMNAKAAK
jgi:small subunit ribosomal protein S20